MIKAILVDDHELFRLGIRTVIEEYYSDIKIVGEAGTGAEFFNLLKTTSADIVLLDIVLPDITGVDIAFRLKKEYPNIKILAISAENSITIVQKMLDIGIDGFITKRLSDVNTLTEAIHSIMEGFSFYGDDITNIIYRIYVSKKKTTEITKEFTEQEKKIIELCRQGMLAKEIAHHLNINSRTVEKHKENIFKKLGISSTLEMIRYALKNGIIQVE
jgi:DNA-binding NarL/FixJ family response regulator